MAPSLGLARLSTAHRRADLEALIFSTTSTSRMQDAHPGQKDKPPPLSGPNTGWATPIPHAWPHYSMISPLSCPRGILIALKRASAKTQWRPFMSHNSESPHRTFPKPSEVASLFGVSPQTVYFWHRMGMIQGIKIDGGTFRIFASSLDQMAR